MPNRSPAVVLVCQPLHFQKSGAWRTILESAGLEVRYPGSGGKVLTGEQLQSELDGVAATIASTEPYSAAILQHAKSLRVVSRTGVGFDSVDTAAATERHVVIACTPGTSPE